MVDVERVFNMCSDPACVPTVVFCVQIRLV